MQRKEKEEGEEWGILNKKQEEEETEEQKSQAQGAQEIMRGQAGSENNRQERRREEETAPSLWGKVQVAERNQRISALPGQKWQKQEALPWQAETRAYMQRHRAHNTALNRIHQNHPRMTQKHWVSLIKSITLSGFYWFKRTSLTCSPLNQATPNKCVDSDNRIG